MINKKGFFPVIAIVALLTSVFIISTAMGFNVLPASISGSGDYIERPIFSYVKCEAISGQKTSTWYNIVDRDGKWISPPDSTNKYSIELKLNEDRNRARIVYSICNSKSLSQSNCEIFEQKKLISSTNEVETISNIGANKYVYVKFIKEISFVWYAVSDDGVYRLKYIPYGLRSYDVLNAPQGVINPNSCSISYNDDSWRDRLLYTDADKIKSKIDENINEKNLQVEEVRWYVTGYLTSAAESFVLEYDNKKAWCRQNSNDGEIYQINTIQLGSGTYKIASPDWSDKLGEVNCCPGQTRGDEICSDEFRWERVQGSECGAFRSCGSPNWVPYSSKEIIKYSCNEGYCEKETKSVECSSDSDCLNTNQICDLSSFECVDASTNLRGDKITITPDTPEECEKKGGTWISEEKTKWFGSQTETIEYCKMPSSINWMKIFLVVTAIGLLFFFRGQIITIFRFLLGKLGVKF